MKRSLLTALAILSITATAAFAGPIRTTGQAAFMTGAPTTTNNDDSCDITLQPAATLLVPYFEVDVNNIAGITTLFTVTNSTRLPQIAHVTVWTAYSFPLLDFNLFLTGYDVQAINMADIIRNGVIASTAGTSTATIPGSRSASNSSNPNTFNLGSCSVLPGTIPSNIVADIRSGLIIGRVSGCGGSTVGPNFADGIARGYVTIDVVSTCSTTLPSDSTYFGGEILFDNVFFGDYQFVNPGQNFAGGNPMVHIKAVPEGGAPGSFAPTNLPYTFYDRYTPGFARTSDRRQPLPSTFAARWIEGGVGSFNTSFIIWREGVTSGSAACATYIQNRDLPVIDLVRFDESENPTTLASGVIISPFPRQVTVLPEASRTQTTSSLLPPSNGAIAGWMYLNLNNGGSPIYSTAAGRPFNTGSTAIGARQSQNWMAVDMQAEGRYETLFDAIAFGNGCSPSPAITGAMNPIGPAPNTTP
jgi:hypothetical protein